MVPNSKLGGTPWVGMRLEAFLYSGKGFIRFDNPVIRGRVFECHSSRPSSNLNPAIRLSALLDVVN